MSILIEGMEMPDTCTRCDYIGLNVAIGCKVVTGTNGRADNCPLTEVPEPHGRLIDADALVEDLKRQCEEVFKIDAVSPDDFWITRDQAYNERLWKTWCESFYKYLESRPTVIPAIEEAE